MPLVTINQSLRDSLKKHDIIPDVVDDFTPSTMISVIYPGNNDVSLGNTLKPSETQKQPQLQIMPEDSDSSKTYTVVLTDPDAPSRDDHKWSEFCHWIMTDVKVASPDVVTAAANADTLGIDLSKATQVVEYMGPAPPEKTGKHRYVFLLYKGSGKKVEAPSDRKKWGHADSAERKGAKIWADKYGLELIGANFFYAQNDKQ
ncbi:uncharacterized protein LAJ45_06197 [Morchella importuna]|uniref:uncharacterized protein n=1 Tax=Morchella importuna TaxID=1174673 RepID=UPI001E8DBECF|nr:uncharacterized protein LAJ45_06197 [Morchella importuna]KAH8149568.1 hypothetical protein LAJ45_06197 [Morchella importuna]